MRMCSRHFTLFLHLLLSAGRLNLPNKYFSFLNFQQGSLNSFQYQCSVSALPRTSWIPFAPCLFCVGFLCLAELTPLGGVEEQPCCTGDWAQDSADGSGARELIYEMQAAEEEVSDLQSLSQALCHPCVSGDVRS